MLLGGLGRLMLKDKRQSHDWLAIAIGAAAILLSSRGWICYPPVPPPPVPPPPVPPPVLPDGG